MVEFLVWVALGLLVLCAALAWLFVILYSRVRWYATPEGRHLMKFTVAFALTYSMTLLFYVVHPKIEVRLVLSIAVFGWTAWEMGNRSRLHLKAKREAQQR